MSATAHPNRRTLQHPHFSKHAHLPTSSPSNIKGMSTEAKVAHRVIVLTGATGAIGGAIARGVLQTTTKQRPHTLVLPVRNLQKGATLQQALAREFPSAKIELEQVDLASLVSIRDLGARLSDKYSHVDVLINNAALVPGNRQESKDGLEMQFAVNVMSYYGLMELLQPLLAKGTDKRVVNVASNYAGGLDAADLQFTSRSYDDTAAYKQSKQANRMLSWFAARKYADSGVTVNACHPGVVTSAVLQNLGMSSGFDTKEKGAATPVFLAQDATIQGITGKYWVDKAQRNCGFVNEKAERALWEECARIWSKHVK